jgi:ligand-binding sensor domain-containing protein/two-component sensor histidine kinase
MWFGTEYGLYRYDGVNLLYFGHKNGDTNSLPNNCILGIAEGKNEKLWISLLSGVACLDLNTLRFKIYSAANKKIDGGNFTNKICVDDDDNVWVGDNAGIFLLDRKKDLFVNVWHNDVNGYPLGSYVTDLASVDKHRLVACTFHDIIVFNKDDHSFKRVPVITSPPPKDSSLTCLFVESPQRLWVGSWGGGVYTYDIPAGKLMHINALQSIYDLPHFYATSIYQTTSGKQQNIWISSSIGLIRYDEGNINDPKEYSFIHYDKDLEHAILPGPINSLYFDNDGALWCVGLNGICRCFPYHDHFKLFASIPGLVIDIQAMPIGKDTSYLSYTWGASFPNVGFQFNDSAGKRQFENLDLGFTDKDDRVNMSGAAKDKYNRLWFSSMAGVSVLDDKFKVVHQWNKDTKGDDALTRYRTAGITIYHDTVWVICYHHGVDLYDLNFKKLKHYEANDGSGIETLVFAFFTDRENNLWLCCNSRLYKYQGGKRPFKPFSLSRETADCGPREVVENKKGEFIIAGSSGLIKFDPKTEKYEYISSSLLEKEQNINSVALDKNDDIWFLTDKHLVHYKLAEKRFILFGQEDGLDVSKGLHELRTFNGKDFFIGQQDRVIKFNSDELNHPITPPYLILNALANDSSVFIDGNNDLVLPHDKNKLQFEFTGVAYIKPDQNQYYYQLSDIDKQWNITYKNSVSYANLDPGSYTFRVKTLNYAGMWSDEKIMHIIITPPYWRTWWFRLLSILTVLSILFFVIRYIVQRNLKERILQLEKITAIEKERNRIAQDMHDDLGSGLTQIAILSEVVKKQIGQPEKAFTQLERISNSSRTLVDNLQDIIWMLNTKHDQLDSLVFYLREYATKYFEQFDMQVTFNYPAQVPPLKINELQRRNLFMALKEGLNNIAKHAHATAVNIGFELKDRVVSFVITDNGRGFTMNETRQFANGLKNMQNRMQQAGGTCSINSEPGKGTSIALQVTI